MTIKHQAAVYNREMKNRIERITCYTGQFHVQPSKFSEGDKEIKYIKELYY